MLLQRYGGDVQNTVEDVQRKFNGTFVRAKFPYRDNKYDATVSIQEIIPASRNIFCTIHGSYVDPKTKRWVALGEGIDHSNFDLIEEYPSVIGARNSEGGIWYFSIKPDRQWKVGLCDANTDVQKHDLKYARVITTAEVPYSAFFPEYAKSLEEGIDLVHTKRRAIALSPVYWLHKKGKEIILFRNRIPVGAFNMKKFFINKPCVDLAQELLDDLRLKV